MNSTPEHLFQFELAPVENIEPWGEAENNSLSLSLYALTDGYFRISVGKETLLRYSPEIIARWKMQNKECASYQVACFARDLFYSTPAIAAPIPVIFEDIVRNESLFAKLQKHTTSKALNTVPSSVINELEVKKTKRDFNQNHYNAFRWLGERSIWLNYLTACPNLWFVRIGDEVWIQWDNVDEKFEGIEVWTARRGTYAMPAQTFVAECHSFAERLLSAMEARIVSIENGTARPKIPLDTGSLRNQLSEFKKEFEKSLQAKYQPDIDWNDAEKAVRAIAHECGTTLPANDGTRP